MKIYISTKIVKAKPMSYFEFKINHRNLTIEESDINRDGYFVKYSNGYESWSPKEVFESSHKEVDTENLSFILKNYPYHG